MGLAASQARFLAITSRKAYCEFQSMQIAQEKLSVTRDLSKISEDYQNALNTTKLVWDYDGTGENAYNLSYGVLMTPTTLNNYNPYLITTRTGSVVLNSQLAAAASVISSTGAATTATEEGYKKFVEALAANGVIPESTAKDISDTDTLPYSKDAGYGGTPLNKNGATASNIVGLAHASEDYNLNLSELKVNNTGWNVSGQDEKQEIRVNGTTLNNEELSELSVSDLLTDTVIYTYTLPDNDDWTGDKRDQLLTQFETNISSILSSIHTAFTSILGTDLVAQSALNRAQQLTQSIFFDNIKTSDSGRSTSGAKNDAINNANTINGIGHGDARGVNHNDTFAINLSNLVSTYLTYFELVLNGYDSPYNVSTQVSSSNFITDDPYYNYVMKDSDSVDNVTVMQADFYMQLYNNICANGWTRNDNIEDDNYLGNALKNGTYFITSLNGDGYFYQGRYNEADCIVEVKDEDAIAQAEAEFTSKKAQLTYKEDKLDLDMKNLDTEISSLTTEYDSVKNLISKNVEKVFTMFQ